MEVVLNCTLSVGEVFDKVSILEIKKEKIKDILLRERVFVGTTIFFVKRSKAFLKLRKRVF